MKINIRDTLLLALLIISFVVLGRMSSAATLQAPKGITVSPAFQQVTVPAGSTQQPVKFVLTNNKSVPQAVSLSVADFSTLNESGGLFFIGTNPTALQKKYGLAKWFSLPQTNLTIQPKQTIDIDGEILNQTDLSPGGHYGALMISLGSGSGSSNTVGIEPIASSLLFVTKEPDDTHHLSLHNVYFNKSLTKLPEQATLRFYNDGNTHVIPRGVVSLISPSGKVVSKGTINENSNIILPATYREYVVPLNIVQATSTPGRYKLEVDFRFDGIDQYRTYQTSFVYLPAVYLLGFGLILLAILIGTILVFKKYRHKNKSKSEK